MYHIDNYEKFDQDNFYGGDDLGAVIVDGKTQFRTWSPRAKGVYLKIYAGGTGNNLVETLPMERHWTGVWFVEILRNLDGYFYTFTYEFNGQKEETIDIYAKACGVNGDRGAIVDFKTTNPVGWEKVKQPVCKNPTDTVIYETHVRDFSIDISSGIEDELRGKFLAFTKEGTSCHGCKTCLDHLVELGVEARAEVLGGEPALRDLGLPAQRAEVAGEALEVLRGVVLAHQRDERRALERALLGARHRQQAVLAQLAALHEAVNGVGENVEGAQAGGGHLQLLEDVLAAPVLLLALPRREELQERAHATDGHPELQEPRRLVRAGEERLGAAREVLRGGGQGALHERELLP